MRYTEEYSTCQHNIKARFA